LWYSRPVKWCLREILLLLVSSLDGKGKGFSMNVDFRSFYWLLVLSSISQMICMCDERLKDKTHRHRTEVEMYPHTLMATWRMKINACRGVSCSASNEAVGVVCMSEDGHFLDASALVFHGITCFLDAIWSYFFPLDTQETCVIADSAASVSFIFSFWSYFSKLTLGVDEGTAQFTITKECPALVAGIRYKAFQKENCRRID
jgi:hypothetical protein